MLISKELNMVFEGCEKIFVFGIVNGLRCIVERCVEIGFVDFDNVLYWMGGAYDVVGFCTLVENGRMIGKNGLLCSC